METIEVRYLQIGSSSFYHKYIVYTDSNGDQFAARGGPEKQGSYFDFSDGQISVNDNEHFFFGPIRAFHGEYKENVFDINGSLIEEGFIDAPKTLGEVHPSETIISGSDLSSYWSYITDAIDGIEAFGYSYGPTGQNSNAVVDYALKEANLPSPQLDGLGENLSPGSGFPLIIPYNPLDQLDDVADFLASLSINGIQGFDFNPGAVLGNTDPLIFDIDRDGLIEMTSVENGVHYDFWGDGFAEKTGWVSADDGILVLDKNGNDLIEGFTEMVASPFPLTYLLSGPESLADENGFTQLLTLDDNADGIIDSQDAAYSTLRIWQDTNQNGVSDAGELKTLAELNIASIDAVGAQEAPYSYVSGGYTRRIENNVVTHESTYTLTDGTSYEVVDVWFDADLSNSQYDVDYTLDVRTLFLPTLRGYGNLPDLHIAMSLDEPLLTEMETFATARTFEELFSQASGVESDVRSLMMNWAGVTDTGFVPTDEQIGDDGVYGYMPEYHFLAELTGINSPYTGTWFDGSGLLPLPELGVAGVFDSFNAALNAMSSRLVFQSGGSALFANNPAYNPATDEFEGDLSLSQTAIGDLGTHLTGHSDLLGAWHAVGTFIENTLGTSNLSTDETNWLDAAVAASSSNSLGWADVAATLVVQDFAIDNAVDTEVHGTAFDDTINDAYHNFHQNMTLYGHEGNDIIEGRNGNDTLIGGLGNDILIGGNGDDQYVYDYGHDVIVDYGVSDIHFAAGINVSDVSFITTRFGDNLTEGYILDVAGRGTISIQRNQNVTDQIDQIHFDSGTVINFDDLDVTVLNTTDDDNGGVSSWASGFSGNYTYYGFDGDDIMSTIPASSVGKVVTVDGGAGNDIMIAGGGSSSPDANNTNYIMSEGNDVINDGIGFNRIIVPDGYDINDLNVYRVREEDTSVSSSFGGDSFIHLMVEIEGLGSTLIIRHFIDEGQPYAGQFDELEFADGTTVDLINQNYAVRGSDQNDSIGTIANSPYVDNDYYFSAGQDQIVDNDGGYDRLIMPDGYIFDDITLYHQEVGNALIIEDKFGNKTTISNYFLLTSGLANGTFEEIVFSDGTVIDPRTLEIETVGTDNAETIDGHGNVGDASIDEQIYGLGGNDTIYGNSGNDILDGGHGDDLVSGNDGDDIFYFSSGQSATNGDYYRGELGSDTLVLRLKDDEQTDAAILAEIAHLQNNFSSYQSSFYHFTTLNLYARGFEAVQG